MARPQPIGVSETGNAENGDSNVEQAQVDKEENVEASVIPTPRVEIEDTYDEGHENNSELKNEQDNINKHVVAEKKKSRVKKMRVSEGVQ